MEQFESCTIKGEEYTHGSEVCEHNRCFRCNDGTWEITDSQDEEDLLF
jgi:hypothetical protein